MFFALVVGVVRNSILAEVTRNHTQSFETPPSVQSVYVLTTYLAKIHFNIDLSCVSRSSKWVLSRIFFTKINYSWRPYPCYMFSPS